jgi:hypothetical protein
VHELPKLVTQQDEEGVEILRLLWSRNDAKAQHMVKKEAKLGVEVVDDTDERPVLALRFLNGQTPSVLSPIAMSVSWSKNLCPKTSSWIRT